MSGSSKKSGVKAPETSGKKPEVKKSESSKKREAVQRKPKQLVPCESCQGTGLELPEGDIKFKSQATTSCKECEGTGSVKK